MHFPKIYEFNSLQGRWLADDFWDVYQEYKGDMARIPIRTYGRKASYRQDEIEDILMAFRKATRALVHSSI